VEWVLLGALAGLAAWVLWRAWPRPVRVAATVHADPYAAQVAEFMRSVSDWNRGG